MGKTTNKKLIIIDGNALIHRSFHALPPTMTTKNGDMVNAVYGFTTVLLKAIREFKPHFVALTLDKKGPTFRHEEYKEYKAHRVKAPDELYEQIPLVKKVAQAFGIPIFEQTGLEADDLIGAIVHNVNGKIEKIIVTGDLDTLQLIDDCTKVYTMSRGLSDSVIYDREAVKARFGLSPSQMIDYKALRGDPSDNIPGVRGIGEKTAVELLKEFKTLDGVYEYAEKARSSDKNLKIRERILGLLTVHKNDAFLSKRLATIKRDASIDFDLEKARFGNFNKEEIIKVFSELEFKSLLPRIQELEPNSSASSPSDERGSNLYVDKFERNKKMFKYILVDTDKKFNEFLRELKRQKQFTFDTETSSVDTLTADLLGVSFSWKKGEAYYVNFQFFPPQRDPAFAVVISNFKLQDANLFNYKDDKQNVKINQTWLEKLKPIMENEKIKKFGHNIKFDIKVMRANGIETQGVEFDTMVASYLLNPGTRQHSLDAVTFTELGFDKISKDDLLGKGKEKISFPEVETEKLSLYSCEDADFTNRLVKKLDEELKKHKLKELFNKIEMPLIQILARVEDEGIKIDDKFLGKMKKVVDGRIKKLEEKIKKLAGVDFNINSTQQLREILFEKLEISALGIGKTKTGFSTSAEELEKLKNEHPIIKLIQEYRELAKLASTYINALPELINKRTGRLHTSFNQTITATGRLSSTEPNLQNIPVRTELGREIRKAFVSDKGYKLIALDYSQIELRLAAHMSNDPKMIKAFKNGLDIHTATASEIHGVPLDKVTYNMRREAKAINFGIIYGQGPHGLSQTADIPYAQAREFIDDYFKVYKNIKKFIDKSIETARKRGYAETLFGRRRYLPEIDSSVIMVKRSAERMAINAPLQGTAADMIKVAMIEAQKFIEKNKDIKMLLQVHDELLFEVKNEKAEKLAKEIKKIMENVLKLKVPIVVDAKVGDNWGEMETI